MTICFADLDGADGLWVPEERTVLVNRRLSEREVAAVIEHELGHVAIDDQHTDLDAGVGRPPRRSRRRTIALTAAAFLAAVAGLTAGLTRDYEGGVVRQEPVVAPSAPPLTPAPPGPGRVFTTMVIGPDGHLQVRTVTLTATPSPTTPAATSAGTVAPPTATTRRPVPAVPSPVPPATSAAPTTTPAAVPSTPTAAPTTPLTPTPTSAAAGVAGDQVAGGNDTGSGSVQPPAGTP